MDTPKYFKRKEFKCNCNQCERDTVDYELLMVLEELRKHFNTYVKVTSGNRCWNYNCKVGGSPHSQHMNGKAADIIVKGIDPSIVYDYLDIAYPNNYGIGKYKKFTHFDVRETKARW